MKTIFIIFALTVVAVKADTIANLSPNYEEMVKDILVELGQIAEETAIALHQQVENIAVEPLQQVEAAVQSIDDLRLEHEACVAAEDEKVAATVDVMHKDMAVCGTVAAKESGEIMIEVNSAVQQLVFDGYDVLMTYQKCQNYKNSVLKNSCYARLSVKATLYTKNARKSKKTVQKNTNERIPLVVNEANICTHSAADIAITELDNIKSTINSCIAKN